MSNRFYDHTTFPLANSLASSAGLRAELDLVEAGFTAVEGEIDGKATASHTHNYAGSVSPGGPASSVANTLTRGGYLTGGNFNGSAATTWAVDATSANTASKVVARDASGNFSAGTITAALAGNAATATALQTARTINGVSFNGSANITVADSTKLPLTGGTISGDVVFGAASSGATVGPNGMTIQKGTAAGANTQLILAPESGALGRDSQILFAATFSDGSGVPDLLVRESGAIRYGASSGGPEPRSWSLRFLTGGDDNGDAPTERMRISRWGAVFHPAVYAPAFVGPLTGNADTATTLSSNRNNWSSQGSGSAVVGQLGWRAYGNDHTIFDASFSTDPIGGVCDAANPDIRWGPSYPCLMGFNGSDTFGVRVDSSRYADALATPRTINGVAFDGTANINIIERGSNSNGIYVRYADGTQICFAYFNGTSAVTTASGSSFVSPEIQWTFPASFSFANNITLSGSVLGTGTCGVLMGSACTVTGVMWRLHSSVSGTFTNPRVIAIGSWK